MEESDFETFSEVWRAAREFKGRPPSGVQINIAFEALRPYTLADVQRGVSAHLRDPDQGQFPVTPADVVRHLAGTSEDKAKHAWNKVERAVRDVGPWRRLVFDDAAIHRTVTAMGGWLRFCTTTDDEWPHLQRDFEKRYSVIRRQSGQHVPFLVGEPQREHITEPVLIGDKRAALEVHKSGNEGGEGRLPSLAKALESMT